MQKEVVLDLTDNIEFRVPNDSTSCDISPVENDSITASITLSPIFKGFVEQIGIDRAALEETLEAALHATIEPAPSNPAS